MAFSSANKGKILLPGGIALEFGTWNGATATSGTVTAQTVTQSGVVEIIASGAGNEADGAANVAQDAGPNVLKINGFTSGDTGTYWFIGRVA